MGVSFVSVENARLNLDREQEGRDFEQIHAEARAKWNDDLSRITVEGGTDAQKTVFLYSAISFADSSEYITGCERRISGNGE